MKQTTFLALLAGVFFFVHCGEDHKTEKLYWQMKNVHDVYCPESADRQACAAVDLNYPFFLNENAIADSLNQLILNALGSKINENSRCASIQSVSDNFIREYQSFLADMPGYQYGWELQQRINVLRDTLGILSMVHESYAYTGGAHGMPGKIFYNINVKSGKVLSISDIIKSDAEANLLAIAKKLFYEQRHIPAGYTLAQAGYWFENNTFYLPDNFSITNEGLLFLYGPYEIASYADGMIELFIPNAEIESLRQKR